MNLNYAKQAVAYYVKVTGKDWSSFFDNVDRVMSMPVMMQDGDDWLLHTLMDGIIAEGVSVTDLKANKDVIKSVFDHESRTKNGEFFTPFVWANELYLYMDKHIPNWREEYNIWEYSCGVGNLVKTAGIPPQNLYMSTLQDSDINVVKDMPEFQGAEIFQLDFLSAVDYSEENSELVNKLPERLQDIIRNDKPLIFIANPPYKSGVQRTTEVGNFMSSTKTMPDYNFTDFSAPAYDLFYQCTFQVMNIVAKFNLSNVWYCFFGPLTYFTGSSANILLQQFEHCFEFVDGMCIAAQEFADTSNSIIWGIGGTVWKARGGYAEGDNFHKPILLDKKFLSPERKVEVMGKVLFEPPREKLSDWVFPKDVIFYEDAPIMTSHLVFKGGEIFEKEAKVTGRIAYGALGTLMLSNTMTRGADQCAILSCPTTIKYASITEENFWRCVASFGFRQSYSPTWSVTKKELSAPNTEIEGYDVWLRNCLVLFLFEYKSMMSSLRNVSMNGNTINIYNKLFFLTEDEIREVCHDEVILKDLADNPLQNQFMLRMIEESKGVWYPEAKSLYDWCKTYTLVSYDYRKGVGYKGSLECADAGFQQVRTGLPLNESDTMDLGKLIISLREVLSKGVESFGFISDLLEGN